MAYEPSRTSNLSVAIRHARGAWLAILADVMVPVDPFNPRRYKVGDERNLAVIERALDEGEDEALVTIKVVGRRDIYQRRVARAIQDQEDWLSLWSDLLNTEVLDVPSWQVFSARSPKQE